jgi:hypothetical protein
MPFRAALVAACLILGAPFTFAQKNDLAPPNPAVAQWNQLIPTVTAALGPQPGCPAPTVVDAAQFAAHGVSVALVKPCPAGTKKDQLTVMFLEDGHLVRARFRDASGNPLVPELLRNDSSKNRGEVQLVPRSNEIFSTNEKRDEHNQELGCGAAVYTWNSHAHTFDLNAKKTKKAYEKNCGY